MVRKVGFFVLAFAIGCFGDVDLEHKAEIASGKDLILTSAQKAAMKSRTNVPNWVKFWPNGVVPYVLDSSIIELPTQVSKLNAAISAYNNKTCIRFIPRTTEANYITFVSGQNFECWSNLGYIGGSQELRINASCSTGNIMHEIFHSLGYIHEHQRYDRDLYVTLAPSLLTDTTNYGKAPLTSIYLKSANSVYDYLSILHYPNINGGFVTKDPAYQNQIGQRAGFSKCDASKINRMYNCVGYEILKECFNDNFCTN